MEYRKFEDTVIIRVDKGEEICRQLRLVADLEYIRLAQVQGIGAVRSIEAGVFDADKKYYYKNNFEGNYEIVSLTGTITSMEGECYPHLHILACDCSGNAVGGHLDRAIVSAAAELTVRIIYGSINRRFSEEAGICLMDFGSVRQ